MSRKVESSEEGLGTHLDGPCHVFSTGDEEGRGKVEKGFKRLGEYATGKTAGGYKERTGEIRGGEFG